jgi:undecaprenyl diphosphate synthase
MDGNGRWANARGYSRTAGHRQGAEAVRRFVRAAAELGIPYLTLFAFSAENWRRPAREVNELMGLLRTLIRRELDELHNDGIRVRVIGSRTALPTDLQGLLDRAEQRTRANGRLTVTFALNYGGRQDIVEATKTLARAVVNGDLTPEQLDANRFAGALSTAGIPDPDLVVRTSGEQRLSNFLLWQCASAEMVFLDKLWPDIDGQDVRRVIETYQCRDVPAGPSLGCDAHDAETW